MKKYISAHIVASHESATFLEKLNEVITHFQDAGLNVEIQYSVNNIQLTALVSAYEEIK